MTTPDPLEPAIEAALDAYDVALRGPFDYATDPIEIAMAAAVRAAVPVIAAQAERQTHQAFQAAHRRADDWRAKAAGLDAEIADLRSRLAASEAEASGLEDQLGDMRATVAGHQLDLDDATRKLATAEQQRDQYRHEVDTLAPECVRLLALAHEQADALTEALRRLKPALAIRSELFVPYTDDPEQTPYSRLFKPIIDTLQGAIDAAAVHGKGSGDE